VYAPPPEPAAAQEPPPRPTIEMAVAAFMADARNRGNGEATQYKKRVVFESGETGLKRFCANKGIRFLAELDLNTIRKWRGT
jgi:hypothetical protein